MKRLLLPAFIVLTAIGVWAVAVRADPATLRPYSFAIDSGTKTATAIAGAATLNKASGIITSEALTTIAGATYTLTITDSSVTASDMVFASVWLGTGTTGTPVVTTVKPGAGSIQIVIQNIAASAVFNGTLKVAFIDLDI